MIVIVPEISDCEIVRMVEVGVAVGEATVAGDAAGFE